MAQLRRCHASKTLRVIALFFSLFGNGRPAMSQLPPPRFRHRQGFHGRCYSGAAITAKSVETGLTRKCRQAEEGSYRLSALPVGAYEVRVELPGFRTEVRSGLTLTFPRKRW